MVGSQGFLIAVFAQPGLLIAILSADKCTSNCLSGSCSTRLCSGTGGGQHSAPSILVLQTFP